MTEENIERRATSVVTETLGAPDPRAFAWVQSRIGPTPMIWYGKGVPTNEGVPIKTLWKLELHGDDYELTILQLREKYPLTEVTKKPSAKPKHSVTLIDWTGAGSPNKDYAINLLLFTKNTRLTMNPDALQEVNMMDHDKKLEQLKYMANTIPSSWEFVDYTFAINGVTRGFTHQLVRTRHASFAQQTMRVLDVSEGPGWDYGVGPTVEQSQWLQDIYRGSMDHAAKSYKALISSGAAIEDARGVLPTNILTNIIMKINMRTFVEMVRKRSSPRVQGEYRMVLEQLKEAVRAVHPWIDLFIERDFEKAAKDLTDMIENQVHSKETRMAFHKLVDQMRSQS